MLSHKVNPWKLATVLLVLVLGLIVSMGFTQSQPVSKTVEAESFILRDSEGNIRGKIWMKAEQPRIQLYDRDGTTIWQAVPNTGDPGIVHPR